MTTDIQPPVNAQCSVAAHLLIVLKSIRASAALCCGCVEAGDHELAASGQVPWHHPRPPARSRSWQPHHYTALHWPHRGSTHTPAPALPHTHLTPHQAGHHPTPITFVRYQVPPLLLSLVGASAPHCIDRSPGHDTTFQSNCHRVDISSIYTALTTTVSACLDIYTADCSTAYCALVTPRWTATCSHRQSIGDGS